MIYGLKLPKIVPAMSTALIEAIYVQSHSELRPGEKILDVTIDLGGSFAQNCPPISHYRFVAREKAVVRRLFVAAGDACEPDSLIATFGTDPEEPADAAVVRPLRITIAGILRHAAMWSMSRSV